jgi:hypothetical protein
MIIVQIIFFALAVLAGNPWFGLGVVVGLELLLLFWQYVWPATQRAKPEEEP